MVPTTGTPSISVALCTRNGARFVEEQVRSILAQTLQPVEIVLSDDESTDATVALVTALVEPTAVELRVFTNDPALGVTKNFEQALLACGGDLIALSDQDDVWRPDRLEVMAARFASSPSLLLAGGDARLVDEAGEPLDSTLFETLAVGDAELEAINNGDAFAALLQRNIVTGATTVIRRELVEAAVPFPDSWVHDEWLASVASAIGRLDLSRDRLVDYRQHGSNQIGVNSLTLAGKVRRLLEPRSSRNARLEARSRALVQRLESWGARVAPAMVEGAKGKLDHERIRNSLPASRLRRIRPVLREARRNGYALYGRGAPDILRDLVQPAA